MCRSNAYWRKTTAVPAGLPAAPLARKLLPMSRSMPVPDPAAPLGSSPSLPTAGNAESAAKEPVALDLVRPGGDGPLRAYRWHLAASRKLPVVMVHGLGDHGRALPYRLLAEVLVAAGFPVWSCDLPGHGEVAPRARGRTRLAALCAELHTLLQQLPTATPAALVGLSMGAVVALSTAACWPAQVAGVVAASLPLGAIRASWASLLAARLLGRVLPGLTVSSGIDLDRVADDAEAVRRYRNDPWVHERVALGLGADLLAAR